MRLLVTTTLEHGTAAEQEMLVPSAAGHGMLAPGACTTTFGCTCCSCTCGVSAIETAVS